MENPSPWQTLSPGTPPARATAQYLEGESQPVEVNFTISALPGDVNGDGIVNVSDVTALVNLILGTEQYATTVCDINGDGEVNVSDVTTLVNMILN